MMLLRRASRPAAQSYDLSITLRGANGTLLQVFPADVIGSTRQLENTLIYKHTLPKLLAVVASVSGEGSTYIALALAATLANDLPARICLIETNWYAPGLGQCLATPAPATRSQKRRAAAEPAGSFAAGPGLAGVLLGNATLDDALIATALPNLHLLPAGELPQLQRPSMARSEALKECLASLAERFDHIIIDTPAVHATSDAIALASLAEGCCLVVRQGVTPTHHIQQALDALQHLNVLGVILNQVHSDLPRWLHALVPQE